VETFQITFSKRNARNRFSLHLRTGRKMTKHIYACGCSFTMKNWRQRGKGVGGWPMWPELLGNELDLPDVNLGLGGHGNDYILQKSVQYILDNHNDIELVVIAWSQTLRMWLYDTESYNPGVWLNLEKNGPNDVYPIHNQNHERYMYLPDPYEISKHLIDYFNRKPDPGGLGYTLGKTFTRQVYTLQRLCEELNLKYIFAHGTPPMIFQHLEDLQINNLTARKEYLEFSLVDLFHKINTNHFIGWPGHRELGGNSVLKLVPGKQSDHEVGFTNLVPDKWDPHPNANGQQLIANLYLNKYKELYG
jgi:hypothetical protein